MRTRTPLPSLVVSFAILHELTAIVPLVSVFFCARTLGIGEQAVAFVRNGVTDAESTNRSWVQDKGAQWIDEGEQWAARVGRRYGVFGYTKGTKNNSGTNNDGDLVSQNLTGNVANAVLAYGVTKA